MKTRVWQNDTPGELVRKALEAKTGRDAILHADANSPRFPALCAFAAKHGIKILAGYRSDRHVYVPEVMPSGLVWFLYGFGDGF